MTARRSALNYLALAAMAGCGWLALAPAAGAQQMTNEGNVPTGPLAEMARMDQPPGEFHLYSSGDVELVRFKEPHVLSLCVGRPDPTAIGSAAHAYPLSVSFDGETSVIEPGNCFAFDAERVKVRPASPLPQNVELSGVIRVIK